MNAQNHPADLHTTAQSARHRGEVVTVVDVARMAGVSKSTAARVLSETGSASTTARAKVLAAAERLGYRPNALARAMARGRTNTIAAVIPDVSSPFFSAVVRGVSDVARAAGCEVVISNTDNDPDVEDRALDVLLQKRVDGIVIAPVLQPRSHAALAEVGARLPVVLVDRAEQGEGTTGFPLVAVDHVQASTLAVRHLLEWGHRRIAIVTEAADRVDQLLARPDAPTRDLPPSSARLLGYLRELRDWGLSPQRDLIVGASFDADETAAAVGRALAAGLDATAMYCTDSTLTLGAYRKLSQLGVALPDELSFVGFDEQDWTTLVRPAITVVDQPRSQLGEQAGRLLLDLIEDHTQPAADAFLPAHLITRNSTGRPRR
ncbi:MAG: LacI family DNA-binding transcriptional regulator [Pseudoclavibacter sp.]